MLRTEGVTVTAAAVRQAAAKLGVKTERSSGELAAAARAAKKTEPAVVAPLAEPLEPAVLCKPPRGVAQKSRVTAPPAEPEVTAADLIRRSDKRGEWGFQDDADCRVSLGKLLDRKCDETGKPRAVVALHLMGTLLREVTG